MKKISFILLTLVFVSFLSCDKEAQIDETSIQPLSQANEFLNSYYSETYSNGKSININNNTMRLSEVLGINQKTPIGYTLTNIKNSELLYFIDVNIINNSISSIDFKNDEKVTFYLDDFFKRNNIKNVDNFSFLNTIKKIDNSSSRRRFWGWSCGRCSTGFPRNFRTCCHYILWMENGCEQRDCGINAQ